jgi:hypothetical protein
MDWDAVLRSEMDFAIEQRRKVKGDEEFLMRVRVVGSHGQIANTPLRWCDKQEKRRAMHVLSEVCKITNAQAAIIVSDARHLNVPGFCKRFNLPEPGPETLDAFEKERLRIMQGYDFYMGNLPRDTWEENLMVMIYGPRVCRMGIVEYTKSGDEIVFEPMMDNRDGEITVSMLQAWWN